MTAAIAAATIWFIPGWMRTEKPAGDVMECVSKVFPGEQTEFKGWDGNNLIWPAAVDSADKESWRFAFDIATMPVQEREKLILVGHSLGGRIAARTLSKLAARGMKIRQAILLGAAIPSSDPDLTSMGNASILPVIAICNPDDVTLRYVYAIAGGEKGTAFGANGTVKPCGNTVEYVVPGDITKKTEIAKTWGKSETLKRIANHHEKFYLDYLKRIFEGEEPSGKIMVPQGYPAVEGRVWDKRIWWDILDESKGWKLEKNKITGHCRIIDPGKRRKAWGKEETMRPAFDKVRKQLEENLK